MHRLVKLSLAFLSVLLLGVGAHTVAAQEIPGLPGPSALASQSLRPYWHVFIAYSIVILAVLGWVISIGRRLKDVQDRIGE